jgi:hypothetical protein
MNLTRDRLRSIGWAFVLTVCFALLMALTFRVNAVKSEVRLAERQIVNLQREKVFLETEFEARANQQKLKAINDVEFGYSAPRAEQYIEGERQLASLGKPRAPGAPQMIRVASAADGDTVEPFRLMLEDKIEAEPPEDEAAKQGTPTDAPERVEMALTRVNLSHTADTAEADGE